MQMDGGIAYNDAAGIQDAGCWQFSSAHADSDTVLVEPIGFLGLDDRQASSRHGATHRISLNLGTFSFSMCASWPQVSAVCP